MIDAKDFADAVRTAAKALDRNPPQPGNAMIGLTTSIMKQLYVEAVGSVATIGAAIPIDDESIGPVWVPGETLAKIVRTLTDAPVELDIADSDVTLRQGRARWTLPRYNDGFIADQAADMTAGGTAPTGWLTETAKKAQAMADTGIKVRQCFLGDGYLLGMSDYGAEVHRSDDVKMDGVIGLLPAMLPAFGDSVLTIRHDDKRIHIHDGETWLIHPHSQRALSLLAGVDKYLGFLDQELPHEVKCDHAELLTAIAQATVVAEGNDYGAVFVRLAWGPDGLAVRTSTAESRIDAETATAGFADFNARYLTMLLEHSESDVIQLLDGTHPAARAATPTYVGRIAGIGKKKGTQ